MSSSSRKLVLFLLMIGLAFVSYKYMIKPANENLALQKTTMEAKLGKLRELDKAKAAADDLSLQLERVEEAIKMFESKLPDKSQIHTVLENLTVIAQKHGLTPKTIKTLKARDNRGYIEQPLKMELDGDFNSYYSFLLELEKLDRITQIRELSLKKKSKYEGQTEAIFVVSIFFQNNSV